MVNTIIYHIATSPIWCINHTVISLTIVSSSINAKFVYDTLYNLLSQDTNNHNDNKNKIFDFIFRGVL